MQRVLIILFAFLIGFSFKMKVDRSQAEVNQLGGFYIFVDSKPVADYDYIATVKAGITFTSGQYQPVRDLLIKKARKKYPNGDGLIFTFSNGGIDRVDVIKFKE
jgi:hypothetical protein